MKRIIIHWTAGGYYPTDYEKEQLVLEFYNAFKGVDYTKAAKINFLKQKAVLNEKQKQKIEIK